MDRSRVWELDEVLALVPAARRPVGAFEYADTNYNLLGLVIEHVRQRPLVDVLRDGVLRVEGTERLIYQPDEAPTDPMAMPRGESRDALEQGGGYLPSISDTIDGAAGAMASDSISLARWWRAFCAGEIVSEASLTEMSTFYDNVESELPVDYGLGLIESRGASVRQGRGAPRCELRLQVVGRVPDRGPRDLRRVDQSGPRQLRSGHTAGHGGALGLTCWAGTKFPMHVSPVSRLMSLTRPTGFRRAGLIIEQVTGRSVGEVLRTGVLAASP